MANVNGPGTAPGEPDDANITPDWDNVVFDPVTSEPPGTEDEDDDEDGLFAAIRGEDDGEDDEGNEGNEGAPLFGRAASPSTGPQRLAGGGAAASPFPAVWAEAPLYAGRGYFARIWKYRHGTRAVVQDRAPITVSSQYLAEQWGPGAYDVEVFEADGTHHASEQITIDRDHEVFANARAAASAPSPSPGYAPAPPSDGMWSFLQTAREADSQREQSLVHRLSEREQRLDEEQGRAADLRVGMAERMVDQTTELAKETMASFRDDRDKWAEREAQHAANSTKVVTEGLTMIMQMQSNNLQLERERMDREEARRESREATREARLAQERQESEARRIQERAEQAARDAAREKMMMDFQRERMEMQKQMFDLQVNMVQQRKDPLTALAPYGAMVVASLPVLEKLGVLDGLKEKVSGLFGPKEPENDWMSLVRTLMDNGTDAFKAWTEAQVAMTEFDEEDDELPMLPDYEGLEQLIHPASGQVVYLDPQTQQIYTPEQVQAAASQAQAPAGEPVGEAGAPEPKPVPPAAPELTPEQEAAFAQQQQAAAAIAEQAALGRAVGGPAVMAAEGIQFSAPGAVPEEAPTPATPDNPFTPEQQAAIAKVPKKQQKRARALMRKLVELIGDNDETTWAKWVRGAVLKDPGAMNAYLQAATIKGAALEAGASPELVSHFLAKLATFDGPDEAIIRNIPTGA